MGAEDRSEIIMGGNKKYVEKCIQELHESDLHECGHGGYTGSWAEFNGRVTFHDKIFKSYNEAEEYLFGKFTKKAGKQIYTEGVVKKWEDVIVVQFRNSKGQLAWLAGACFSC